MMSSSFAIVELYTAVSSVEVESALPAAIGTVAARMTGRPTPLPVDFVRTYPINNPRTLRGHFLARTRGLSAGLGARWGCAPIHSSPVTRGG